MTVSELIEILQSQTPDAKILIASDAEGNDYSGIGVYGLSLVDQVWDGERTDNVFDDAGLRPEEIAEYQQVFTIWPV